MKNISRLIVILIIVHACSYGSLGQGSPGGYLYSATINDSLLVPVRMAHDNMDNIYVTDALQKKIKIYNASGNYAGSIETSISPISIAINDAGQVYTGDRETGKIFRINSNGTASELYAGTVFPSSMVFCSDGFLYVTDSKLQRVIVLDLSGNLIRTIGEGTLTYPTGITFDKKNNRILVAEHGGIGTGFDPVVKVWIFGLTGNLISSFGSNGSTNGKFYRIQGLAVGRCGEIYVSEPYQGSISVFSETTVFLTKFGQYGNGPGQIRVPLDIAINSQDKLFITSENNGMIAVYDIAYLLPTANINCGNKTICAGTTTDIPVHFTGTAPWTFTYTINGINPTTVSNTMDNPYLLTVSQPGNYQVTAISDSGSTGTCVSGNSVITVNSLIPTSTIITPAVAFCPGQTGAIAIGLTGLPPWTFTYTINGSTPHTVSNVSGSPFLLNISDTGTYAITALSSPGCSGSNFTGTSHVTKRTLPTATITNGNASICAGVAGGLSVNLTGTAPWSVTYTINNGNPVTLNAITANPFHLDVSLPGDYRITQVQDAFCTSDATSGSPEITVKELPTATISSGNGSVCAGDTSNFIVDFTGTAPWNFTYTLDSLHPVNINGVTSNPYAVPVSQAGTYQLTAISDAVCTGIRYSGSSTLTLNPLPIVSLGPASSLCPGDSIVLDPGFFPSYFWNDSTLNRLLTVYSAGNYGVTVTDYYGCSGAASKIITSLIPPTSAITSGNASICLGQTTNLTVVLTGIPPWSFTYTVNGANPRTVSNVTQSPYLLNVYEPGLYQIAETIDAQCTTVVSADSATITVNPLPTYNFSSGNASFCTGESASIVIDLTGTPPWAFTYTINGINPVTVTGIMASPYIMHVSTAGIYEITAISDAHCSGIGHRGNVAITENPLPVVYLGPDVTINAGELLTLDAGPSYATYSWSDGSTAQTLVVSTSGIYMVTVTDFNGCRNYDTIDVTVVIPVSQNLENVIVAGVNCFNATQTLTLAGNGTTFLVHDGGNATLIAGHNIIFLPETKVDSGGYLHGYITQNNSYCFGLVPPVISPASLVEVNSCPDSTTGKSIDIVLPNTIINKLANVLKVYPNPSTGSISIEVNNPAMIDLKIEIYDMAVRRIYSKSINSQHSIEKVDLGGLSPGIYTVKLSSWNLNKITKLVLID